MEHTYLDLEREKNDDKFFSFKEIQNSPLFNWHRKVVSVFTVWWSCKLIIWDHKKKPFNFFLDHSISKYWCWPKALLGIYVVDLSGSPTALKQVGWGTWLIVVGPIGCRPYSWFCLLLLLLQCRPSSPFLLPFPPLKLIFCLPPYRATFWSATLPLRWAGQREGVCNIAADART